LRRHLARLVELEYVLAYRSGNGNQREMQEPDDRCCQNISSLARDTADTRVSARRRVGQAICRRTWPTPQRFECTLVAYLQVSASAPCLRSCVDVMASSECSFSELGR
jgi:hypothetical protein